MRNLVVKRHTNFVRPMDRVVQSASIQYNRVGSKDLNFALIGITVFPIDFIWGFHHLCEGPRWQSGNTLVFHL